MPVINFGRFINVYVVLSMVNSVAFVNPNALNIVGVIWECSSDNIRCLTFNKPNGFWSSI